MSKKVELKVGSTITITNGTAETIYGIRGKLYDEHKITFDTGYGKNGHDWELDWSLEHSSDITRDEAITLIKKYLDEAKLTYTVNMQTYED